MIHDRIQKKVHTATARLEDKTLVSYLAACFTDRNDTFMLQKDFTWFVRLFFPSITDTEVNELAQSYSKKDRSQSLSGDLSLEEQSSTTANPKVPLAELDIQFDKWYKEE